MVHYQCLKFILRQYKHTLQHYQTSTQKASTLVTKWGLKPKENQVNVLSTQTGLPCTVCKDSSHQHLFRCPKILDNIGEYPNKKPLPDTVC